MSCVRNSDSIEFLGVKRLLSIDVSNVHLGYVYSSKSDVGYVHIRYESEFGGLLVRSRYNA